MCDVDYEEYAQVCKVTRPKAAKAHECSECRMAIIPGTAHTRIDMLFDGNWDRFRIHDECLALVKYIAFDVCDQFAYFLANETLRERVREHYRESPEVLRKWRDILRLRRAEGTWPVLGGQ